MHSNVTLLVVYNCSNSLQSGKIILFNCFLPSGQPCSCISSSYLFPFDSIKFTFDIAFVTFAVMMLNEQTAPATTFMPTTSLARHFPTSVLQQEQRDESRLFLKEEKTSQVKQLGPSFAIYSGVSERCCQNNTCFYCQICNSSITVLETCSKYVVLLTKLSTLILSS